MGYRASHRPIASPLSPTSDTVDVVHGLLFSLSVSPSLYVADLEAIERNGENLPALRIRKEFPALRVGIDNGAAGSRRSSAQTGPARHRKQISARRRADRDLKRIVLSLDFYRDAFQGPAEILSEPDFGRAK
jgi:phosphoribosylformimino-5-aminoimidazole carboxamide ribotide isomerase